MSLSKSRYCKGIQCPKMLWMDINKPELFDQSVMNETILNTGNVVGDLAMGYFGEFAEVPFSQDKSAMLVETQRLLSAGTRIITEASFSFDGNYCIVDILRTVNDGYELVEVKSSTFAPSGSPDEVKPIYMHDMAYQAYVLNNCGLKIKKVSIMQLNREYVRRGELDLGELFVLIDCTDRVSRMQSDIAQSIADIKTIAGQDAEPVAGIGSRCDNPYECGYKGWCFRELPENNVFQIGWSMWKNKKDDAYHAGYTSFEDVLAGGVPLSGKQRRQLLTVTQNLPPHVDSAAIRKFLSQISYPLYHLDFETFQQAVPLWDGISPYAQIPFQYSLHIQDELCGEAVHNEFLGEEGIDPRRTLAERLCTDIPRGACVIAYNMSFEKSRLKELARTFPDLAGHLMNIHDNMVDLATPFQSGAYYCREMGGSYSIKSVLPALCPDDRELDYTALNIIHNGNEAMNTYATLHEKQPEEIAEIRAALMAYCRLDTLAMVKVLGKLYQLASVAK